MAALAKKHKQNKRKRMKRIDNNEVIRKPDVRLYVYVDDDGAFDPPFEIQDLMATIDTMLDNGDIEEEDIGRYEAIQTILATPVALMMDKVKTMLEEIVETGVQNHLDSLDDDDKDQCELLNQEENETVYHHNSNWKESREEDPTVPMSLNEVDDWYRKVTGHIDGFYQASHARKYELMQEFLAEKERENRDLTDDEMMEELEGPEQSD